MILLQPLRCAWWLESTNVEAHTGSFATSFQTHDFGYTLKSVASRHCQGVCAEVIGQSPSMQPTTTEFDVLMASAYMLDVDEEGRDGNFVRSK
jgi:hypothetical protein